MTARLANFALDVSLATAKIGSEAALRRAMEGHVLEQAELVSRYTSRSFKLLKVVLEVIGIVAVLAAVYWFISRRRKSGTRG